MSNQKMTDQAERDRLVMWVEQECQRRGVGVMALLDQLVAETAAPDDGPPRDERHGAPGEPATGRTHSLRPPETPPSRGDVSHDEPVEWNPKMKDAVRRLRNEVKVQEDTSQFGLDILAVCDCVEHYTDGFTSADTHSQDDLRTLGAALIADLESETERTGSEACPCVYCSYWAESDKCALKRVMSFLHADSAPTWKVCTCGHADSRHAADARHKSGHAECIECDCERFTPADNPSRGDSESR